MGITLKPSMTASSAFERIDFGDDDVGAHAARAGGQSAPAPAVAGHHEGLAGQQHVGGADDAVNGGLPGAVAVVEEMFGQRVVDGHDRVMPALYQRPWRAGG